jgi:hypothetical protein
LYRSPNHAWERKEKKRQLRSEKLAELSFLENIARQRGQITGPKTRGRKSKLKTVGH